MNAEYNGDCRQRKNKKVNKTKSSTERVRKFRARQKALLNIEKIISNAFTEQNDETYHDASNWSTPSNSTERSRKCRARQKALLKLKKFTEQNDETYHDASNFSTASNSTERVRKFRARQKALLTVENNISYGRNNAITAQNDKQDHYDNEVDIVTVQDDAFIGRIASSSKERVRKHRARQKALLNMKTNNSNGGNNASSVQNNEKDHDDIQVDINRHNIINNDQMETKLIVCKEEVPFESDCPVSEEEFISLPKNMISEETMVVAREVGIYKEQIDQTHTKNWSSLNWICYHCRNTFASYCILKTHLQALHNKTNIEDDYYQCSDCHDILIGYSTFITHVRTVHHEALKLCCDVCNQIFPDFVQLSFHRDIHNDSFNGDYPIMHNCYLCENAYSSEKELKNHIQLSHNEIYR